MGVGLSWFELLARLGRGFVIHIGHLSCLDIQVCTLLLLLLQKGTKGRTCPVQRESPQGSQVLPGHDVGHWPCPGTMVEEMRVGDVRRPTQHTRSGAAVGVRSSDADAAAGDELRRAETG